MARAEQDGQGKRRVCKKEKDRKGSSESQIEQEKRCKAAQQESRGGIQVAIAGRARIELQFNLLARQGAVAARCGAVRCGGALAVAVADNLQLPGGCSEGSSRARQTRVAERATKGQWGGGKSSCVSCASASPLARPNS